MHLRIAFRDSNKGMSSQPQRTATQCQATERLCNLEEGWSGGSWLKELQNIPTTKSSPEYLLQKFYLVVRVSLRIGFFKKGSCIGHRASINLGVRREKSEDDLFFLLGGAFSRAGRGSTNHTAPTSSHIYSFVTCLLCCPPARKSVSY